MPTINFLAGFKEAYMQLSANGWVNITIFQTLKDIFIPFVTEKTRSAVLFVDGHTSNNSDIGTLEMCEEHGIILYGLLPHAFHIIQPLALSIFGSMKSRYPVVVKQYLEKTGETPTPCNFFHLLKKVWEHCARQHIKNIKNKPTLWGFKVCYCAEAGTGYLLNFRVYRGKRQEGLSSQKWPRL